MTVGQFKIAAGIALDGWAHERVVDGLRHVYVPGEISGRRGWWWAIATIDGDVLTFGWAAGSVRDRNMDIASALVRVRETYVIALN